MVKIIDKNGERHSVPGDKLEIDGFFVVVKNAGELSALFLQPASVIIEKSE